MECLEPLFAQRSQERNQIRIALTQGKSGNAIVAWRSQDSPYYEVPIVIPAGEDEEKFRETVERKNFRNDFPQ